jgi:hypothetical protein
MSNDLRTSTTLDLTQREATDLWEGLESVIDARIARSPEDRDSTIRLRLDRVDFLRETDKGDPIGFTTKVSTIKNRMAGGIGKSTTLSYIFGEGFSIDYDYFMTAIKLGIITKSGAWVYVGKGKDDSKLTVQGLMSMYKTLKSDAEEAKGVFDWIKKQIDGEDEEPVIAEVRL